MNESDDDETRAPGERGTCKLEVSSRRQFDAMTAMIKSDRGLTRAWADEMRDMLEAQRSTLDAQNARLSQGTVTFARLEESNKHLQESVEKLAVTTMRIEQATAAFALKATERAKAADTERAGIRRLIAWGAGVFGALLAAVTSGVIVALLKLL